MKLEGYDQLMIIGLVAILVASGVFFVLYENSVQPTNLISNKTFIVTDKRFEQELGFIPPSNPYSLDHYYVYLNTTTKIDSQSLYKQCSVGDTVYKLTYTQGFTVHITYMKGGK